MKLKRDSWYGNITDHPKSWCSFILIALAWVSMAVLWVGGVTIGNWELGKMYIAGNDKVMLAAIDTDIASWGLCVDVITVIIALILMVHYWPSAWFADKFSGVCPKLEWE